MYCKNCGQKNDIKAEFCSECGCNIKKDVSTSTQNKSKKYSIAGFICSLCGIFTCGISSIIGLIFSIIGLSESKKEKRKDGFAIAGIILSSLFIIGVIALMVVSILFADEVEVIDFSVETEESAKQWCDSKEITCHFSEEYSDTVPIGGFISQSVEKGRIIKSYSSIYIVYSKGKQEEIKKDVQEKETKQLEPQKTEEEIRIEYKNSCQAYGYKDIARQPESYRSQRARFRGKVLQVSEDYIDSKKIAMRVYVTEGEYGFWDDIVYVTYKYKTGENKILEDDIINMYGTLEGTKSYTSILGSRVTLPLFHAKYIDIE